MEAVFLPPQHGQLPAPRQMVIRNQVFLQRATGYAAGQGVAQFAHLGAGYLPPRPYVPVHEAAPAARTACVDTDPTAVLHTRALAVSGRPAAVAADLTRPGEVIAALGGLPEPQRIDFAAPVCVILAMVLHFMPAEQAREVTAGYVAAMAPGNFLIVTCVRCDPPQDDPGLWERIRAAHCREVFNHDPGQVASFFGGLELSLPA